MDNKENELIQYKQKLLIKKHFKMENQHINKTNKQTSKDSKQLEMNQKTNSKVLWDKDLYKTKKLSICVQTKIDASSIKTNEEKSIIKKVYDELRDENRKVLTIDKKNFKNQLMKQKPKLKDFK